MRETPLYFPVAAGFVAILAFSLGGGSGHLIAAVIDAPAPVRLAIIVTGYAVGFLMGRSILGQMFMRGPSTPKQR